VWPGKGAATADYDPKDPPWWPIVDTCDATHCCLGHIASWIDAPSMTPIDRYWGVVGMVDTQFGADMLSMERMSFVGQPVNITEVAPPYGGSHRLYASGIGHVSLAGYPVETLNVVFGVLPENLNPTF